MSLHRACCCPPETTPCVLCAATLWAITVNYDVLVNGQVQPRQFSTTLIPVALECEFINVCRYVDPLRPFPCDGTWDQPAVQMTHQSGGPAGGVRIGVFADGVTFPGGDPDNILAFGQREFDSTNIVFVEGCPIDVVEQTLSNTSLYSVQFCRPCPPDLPLCDDHGCWHEGGCEDYLCSNEDAGGPALPIPDINWYTLTRLA